MKIRLLLLSFLNLFLLGCGINNKEYKIEKDTTEKTIELVGNQESNIDTFEELLNRANMSFTKPEGFKEVVPIKNNQMNWEKSFRHQDKRFEVRYAIRPIDNLLNEHQKNEANKKEGDINIHPNKLFESIFKMTVLNISGGNLPEFTIFPKQAVKKEFNADWGATTTMFIGEEFGQDYKYCLLVFLHKDNFGDGYIFYLADDKELLTQEMTPLFHSLVFKRKVTIQ